MHIELDHTEDKDQQMYANWSFPNFTVWNDYYFSDNRTQLLRTQTYKLGKEQLKDVFITALPEKKIEKFTKVVKRIWNIPIEYGNEETSFIKLLRVLETD